MGQLYSVIMIMGTYIVITKYKFLRLPEKFLLEEIENKIMDMVILLNEKYEIIRISKHTLDLLNFEKMKYLIKILVIYLMEILRKKLILGNIKKEEKSIMV